MGKFLRYCITGPLSRPRLPNGLLPLTGGLAYFSGDFWFTALFLSDASRHHLGIYHPLGDADIGVELQLRQYAAVVPPPQDHLAPGSRTNRYDENALHDNLYIYMKGASGKRHGPARICALQQAVDNTIFKSSVCSVYALDISFNGL